MASCKKDSEGIALLSMYNDDEEDEEMDDVEEPQQRQHHDDYAHESETYSTMKRAIPWSDQEEESSSDESSSSQSDSEGAGRTDKTKVKDHSNSSHPSKENKSKDKCKSGRRKSVDFEALRQHGYKGGLSVLSVPPPKDDVKHDWSWSTGKERPEARDVEESYQERQKTRAALKDGEELADVRTMKDRKSLSYSQKEKRKRELGQTSRGKNYVEEEKRLLRESGVYSGFDA